MMFYAAKTISSTICMLNDADHYGNIFPSVILCWIINEEMC